MGRQLVGTVVSNKRDKTLGVKVITREFHKKFGKIVPRSKTYHVHVESDSSLYGIGEKVSFEETVPISKTKKWIIKDRISNNS